MVNSLESRDVLAYQTYLELTEVDGLKNLSCKFDDELEISYIVEGSTDNIFVPVHYSFVLTPSWIQNIHKKLCATEPKSFILVIREADSTFVRHRLTAGILPSPVDCRKKTS